MWRTRAARALHELDDRLEILVGVPRHGPIVLFGERTEDRSHQLTERGRDFDQDWSPIHGVADPADEARGLEPVDDRGDGPRGEADQEDRPDRQSIARGGREPGQAPSVMAWADLGTDSIDRDLGRRKWTPAATSRCAAISTLGTLGVEVAPDYYAKGLWPPT